MKRQRLALAALCLMTCGCSQEPAEVLSSSPAGKPAVYAVNYPLAFFARFLGGDLIEVVLPVPSDVDPAHWQPAPEAVLDYQSADLILLNGAGYARWVDRVSLPSRALVDTSERFAEQLISVAAGPVHSHGPQGEHSHGELAITTWLDLNLAIEQARTIAAALGQLSPELELAVSDQLPALEAELHALDVELLAAGKALDGAPVLFSHPVYQYFARRYGLSGPSLDWEPDVPAGPEALKALDALLESQPARLMIWEAEPRPETRAALQARGIAVVIFNPSANAPENGDLLSVFSEGVRQLEQLGQRTGNDSTR